MFDNHSSKPHWDFFVLRKRRELERICASKSVGHETVGRDVEGWDRQGHLVLYWKMVSNGVRNLTEYLLVFGPQLRVKRPAGCIQIFNIVRSEEKKRLLTSGGCSMTASMLSVAVFDSLALSVFSDLLWTRCDYYSEEHLSFCRCVGSELEIPGSSYPQGIEVAPSARQADPILLNCW